MSKSDIDRALIRELAALLTETGLTEIEVGDKDRRLRVVRAPAAVAAMPVA
ncbi:MAG: acetyl-CoA carboxylase biotin carboxyl carrier protein, partial [Alphaproteobacteria bacterium]|nr:acetyl-CoA carboxylase biotin carboxyl carrier protein [Alphaproteobacteria bacterium]